VNEPTEMPGPDCRAARETIHRALDAASMPDTDRDRLDAHLDRCAACRALADDLATLQAAMRALPQPTFPDDALEAVWRETTRSGDQSALRRWGLDWRFAAAAAVMLFAVLSFVEWPGGRTTDPFVGRPGVSVAVGPSEAELQRAAAETRLVLGLTADALNRTGRVVKYDVLEHGVSYALRRVAIRWSEKDRGRNGT
jgi:predicted anti-sigma-YlaC factor YlaD